MPIECGSFMVHNRGNVFRNSITTTLASAIVDHIHMSLPPRFTVRTLAIVVTLVCAYFGAWEATKRHAELISGISYTDGGKEAEVWFTHAPMPLIVCQDELVPPFSMRGGRYDFRKRYYLWLLGLKVRLPIESEW
jgi:hypothetical protein